MKWKWLLGGLIAGEFVADILAKEYSLRASVGLGIAALSMYCIGNAFWLWSLRTGSGLARGGVIFSSSFIILCTFVGVILYHEHLTILQWIGVVLGIGSVICLLS